MAGREAEFEVAASAFAADPAPPSVIVTLDAGAVGVVDVETVIRLTADGIGAEGVVSIAPEGALALVVVVAAGAGATETRLGTATEVDVGMAGVAVSTGETVAAAPEGEPTALALGTDSAIGADDRVTGAEARFGALLSTMVGNAIVAGAAVEEDAASSPEESGDAVREGTATVSGAMIEGSATVPRLLTAGVSTAIETSEVADAVGPVRAPITVIPAGVGVMAEVSTIVPVPDKRTSTEAFGDAGKFGPIASAPIASEAESAPVTTTGGVAGMAAGATGSVMAAVAGLADPLAPSSLVADVAEDVGAATTTDTAAPPPESIAAREVGIANEAGSLRGSSTAIGWRCAPMVPWRAGPLSGGTGYPGPPLLFWVEFPFEPPGLPGPEVEAVDGSTCGGPEFEDPVMLSREASGFPPCPPPESDRMALRSAAESSPAWNSIV